MTHTGMTQTIDYDFYNGADNLVVLRGRISVDPTVVALPSGDEIVTFRLVVPRSAAARRRGKQKVDTFDCAVWTARLRKQVSGWRGGDTAVVQGELRRRFHRSGAAVMSRVTVDVSVARRTSVGG